MLTYKEAIRFHGHDGPFLALGFKAGRFILRNFIKNGETKLSCVVKLKMEKPFSCVIDGLQCSTDLTIGKCNLKIEESDNEIPVFVCEDKKTGQKISFTIKEEIFKKAKNCKDLHKCASEIISLDPSLLFVFI